MTDKKLYKIRILITHNAKKDKKKDNKSKKTSKNN